MLEDFIDYYNKVSATFDDDKKFEVMMNSVWNLNKGSLGR